MTDENFFLGRQPILDRQQSIFGYELLFRSADVSSANVTDYTFACASVISSAMANFGFQEVLGRHFGFINVDTEFLMSDALELLPKEQVVLELLEVIEVNDAVINRCHDLKRKGFSLALDDHVYSIPYEPLYEIIEIIKVDLLLPSAIPLPEMVQQLKRLPAKLLAEKVETVKQFNECLSLGFEYFQGYFFAVPVVLKKKRIDIAGSSLVRLQQLLLNDAEIAAIEETFRQNPNLVCSLLRLVNSVAMGLVEKIRTLRHAIAILGRRQLLRWTYLAMFSADDNRPGNGTLLELAAMRGRLLELIVQRYIARHRSSDFHEIAFIVGILSLVDLLFEVPMEQVVCHFNLTEEVRSALLYRTGELGVLLQLIEHLECCNYGAALPILAKIEIGQEQLFIVQLEAIQWTHGLSTAV